MKPAASKFSPVGKICADLSCRYGRGLPLLFKVGMTIKKKVPLGCGELYFVEGETERND